MTVVVNVGKMFYFKRAMLTQDCVLYLGKLPFFSAAPVEFPFHYTLSPVSLFSDLCFLPLPHILLTFRPVYLSLLVFLAFDHFSCSLTLKQSIFLKSDEV